MRLLTNPRKSFIIKFMKEKCNVIGFDICSKFVEICIKNNFNVIESDILDIPFDNNFFDYIYMNFRLKKSVYMEIYL